MLKSDFALSMRYLMPGAVASPPEGSLDCGPERPSAAHHWRSADPLSYLQRTTCLSIYAAHHLDLDAWITNFVWHKTRSKVF
eukprot:6175845-Pleurochrysis_carterae.AAC.1